MSDITPVEKSTIERNEAEAEYLRHKARGEEARANDSVDRWKMSSTSPFDARTVTIYGVDQSSCEFVINVLNQWAAQDRDDPERKDWTLRISSPGGSAIAGFALIDVIQKYQSEGFVINTEAYGMAASMGGVLLQVGNTRRIGKNCYVLIHEVSGGAGGSIGQIEDQAKFLTSVNKRARAILESRAKISKAQFTKAWNRKDWWMEADEAIKLGFADEIIEGFDYDAS